MVADQADTRPVSTRTIMRSIGFRWGVNDYRTGHPFRDDVPPSWDWDYERGRQFAAVAPKDMPLKINGRLNPKAVATFEREAIL
jgi:hypothetical protein